jgi:hypothetical protein
MTRELPEAQREALQKQIPLGRLGQAEEIALWSLFPGVRRCGIRYWGYNPGERRDVHELNVTDCFKKCHTSCLKSVIKLQLFIGRGCGEEAFSLKS